MIYFLQNISKYQYYIIIIAFIFYILAKLNTSILMAILIVIIIGYYLQQELSQNKNNNISIENKLKDDVNDVKELTTSNFYVKENAKQMKYLVKNQEFVDILQNIRFTKKFDKSKYSKLIIYMDKIMKVYVYILCDRYDLNTYLPVFNDLKYEILELMYSLIFVVPERLKHSYGFDPNEQIQKSLEDFYKKTNSMIKIIRNYSKIGKKEVFFNFEKYRPYEQSLNHYLP